MKNSKNSKKKLVSLLTATTLVGAVAVGGTLAYFTDRDEATNVIATGNVKVELTDSFDDATKVVPNQKFDGEISVENTGVNNAFIRLSIAPTENNQLTLEDIQKTFQTQEELKETFDTKEEAEARVAALSEEGTSAKVVDNTTEVEESVQAKNKFVDGAYRYIYVVENGKWVEKKAKPNTEWANYEWNGVKYQIYQTKTMFIDGKIAYEDDATYVLAEDGCWYRNRVIETTKYDVVYAGSELVSGFNAADWTLAEDGYYYYNDVFEAGETSTLVSGLHIPAEWGNSYADKTMAFDVVVEAIQADFLEDAEGNEITDAQAAFNLGIEIEE